MKERIKALTFTMAPHRVALAVTAGRLRPDVRHGATGSPLRLREIVRPERPPGWVRIAPTLSGICASDRTYLKITGMGTSALPAFYGLPTHGVVLGHEVVGRVVEADPESGFREGDRVVAEPTVACHHKGFTPCDRCEAGNDHRCEHLSDAGTAPAPVGFGFDARVGGGWAEELVAPADRVHRVPDGLSDRVAVLAEPTAVSTHAVVRNLPASAERVLVIGPGTIGLSVVHALRVLAPSVEVVVAGVSPSSDEVAMQAGAKHLIHGTRTKLVNSAAEVLGARTVGNRMTGPVLEDGFDVVFDAVGSSQTLDDAARMTRPGGRIVLVGASFQQEVDWSLVWFRELQILGTAFYAVEDGRWSPDGQRRRTMQIALDVLDETRPEHLVTHVFTLDESVKALSTSADGPNASAVKVAFSPQD